MSGRSQQKKSREFFLFKKHYYVEGLRDKRCLNVGQTVRGDGIKTSGIQDIWDSGHFGFKTFGMQDVWGSRRSGFKTFGVQDVGDEDVRNQDVGNQDIGSQDIGNQDKIQTVSSSSSWVKCYFSSKNFSALFLLEWRRLSE